MNSFPCIIPQHLQHQIQTGCCRMLDQARDTIAGLSGKIEGSMFPTMSRKLLLNLSTGSAQDLMNSMNLIEFICSREKRLK